MKNNKPYERYQRQIILKEFGVAAQEKISHAKLLVIGAGGLGCPALQYLVATGVGTIGIVDDDVVSLTNLHRQVLYNIHDIGLPKAEVAAEKLKALNDEINIIAHNTRITNNNSFSLISDYDIVFDGTDNFSSRYMINDACVLLNKPLVYGAILKFEGQVAVFNAGNNLTERNANYRDLFPVPPKEDEVLNCAEAGVLGVLPGIIGIMMANETIKLITGIGKPLINSILIYNAFYNTSCEFKLSLNPEAQMLIPKDELTFLKTDYEWLCSSQTANAFEIDVYEFDNLLDKSGTVIIDVREIDEQPFVDEFKHIQVPLNDLMLNSELVKEDNVVVFCQSGKRSLAAAKFLVDIYKSSKKIYSLKGGIVEWKKKHAHEAAEVCVRK